MTGAISESRGMFDLQKVKQVNDNYTINDHAGLTLVIGHPFTDEVFKECIVQEQNALKGFFQSHGLEDILILYDVSYQVHATLIELASQHDKEKNDQDLLHEHELSVSSKTQTFMNINYTVRWIQKTPPFAIELGPNVLSSKNSKHTLRITDSGQIVMKGRARDRKLLAEIREEFEEEAGIIHKYGKEDDEFFFVIGYLKPHPFLQKLDFCADLEKHLDRRRPNIQLALKVDAVKIIMYRNFSLDKHACLWESKECKLLKSPELPHQNLLDSVINIIRERKLSTEQLAEKAM